MSETELWQQRLAKVEDQLKNINPEADWVRFCRLNSLKTQLKKALTGQSTHAAKMIYGEADLSAFEESYFNLFPEEKN